MTTSSPAPNLLNDDGTASMATPFLMSHHAFRRDLGCFARARARLDAADTERAQLLRQEWANFRGALHGHNQMEDARVFPHVSSQHPELAAAIQRLSSEHHLIDPLLARGDAAFSDSWDRAGAQAVIAELEQLLSAHLAFEEATIVPTMRQGRQFPPPGSDEEAEMYAQGFAWSSHGVAPSVLAQLNELLPEPLKQRLPAAREKFAERFQRTFGEAPGSATTSVPSC